jgi:hypothetical protein
MSADARTLIDGYGDDLGWSDSSKIDLLCDYINNQQDGSCLNDFLERQAQEEKSYDED